MDGLQILGRNVTDIRSFVLVYRRWTRDHWELCSTAYLMIRGVSASWPAWRHGSTLKYEIFHSHPTHVSFFFWTGFIFMFLYVRWHPSECRVCCCLSSPNWSTSPSSETFGQHTHAQGFSVTGWASDILQTFTFNTWTDGKTTTRTWEGVRPRVNLVFLLSFVSQGNKGGLSVRMSFYGHTLCFLNCHLAAHMQYALERVDEFEYIMDTQTFDCKETPKVLDHRWGDKHHTAAHSSAAACNFSLPSRLVFWFGDLNFRIQDHGIHFVRSCISSQNYDLLWSKDQVTPAQEARLKRRGW